MALQEVGRELASYVHKKKRVGLELEKRGYITKYIPYVGEALKELLGLKDIDERKVEEYLKELLEKKRGSIDDLEFDPSKNEEYDEEYAKIGKESDDESDDKSEKESDDEKQTTLD